MNADEVQVPLRHGVGDAREMSVRALDGAAALAWHRGRAKPGRRTALMARQGTRLAGVVADTAGLRALTVGDRERVLLALYAEAFGPELELVGTCAGCGETVEFDLSPEALRPDEGDARDGWMTVGGDRIRVRVPSGGDADDAAALGGAAQRLAAACLPGGEPLTDRVREALAVEVARRDPEAAAEVTIMCPDCAAAMVIAVDAAALLDARLPGEARLIAAVDQLARAYGWTERDVLAVPLARLPAYLAAAERLAA